MNPTVTAAMIVRDGGDLLKGAIESVLPHVDDLVVVDTGSEDDSRAVAKSLGARVYDFKWVDNFAAARNESWSHIKTDFGMWLDHDDVIRGAEFIKPLIKKIYLSLPPPNPFLLIS